MSSAPSLLRIVIAYVSVVVIWSTTPLAVVMSLRALPPLWAVTVRTCAAAVIAWAIVRAVKEPLPWDRSALKVYAAGSLAIFGAMFFTYMGARTVPSGLISVLFGLAPLLIGVIAMVAGREQGPGVWRMVALLVAVAGLAVIFVDGEPASIVPMAGVLLILGGVLSYVVSSVALKVVSVAMSPLAQTTGSLIVSAALYVLALLLLDPHWPVLHADPSGWAALLWSILSGSIIAMLCCFWLLRHLEAGTVALSTLMTPVIALMLGLWLNNERFASHVVLGIGMILGGIVLYHHREISNAFGKRALMKADA